MTRAHWYAALVAAGIALIGWGCGGSSAAPSSTAPFVAGQVLDFQTNAGVSGANVVFADPSNTTTIVGLGHAATGSGGSYQMSVPTGHYAIYVDNTYGGQAIVRTGANRADLLVHAAGCVVRYGTIADGATGRPLAGAAVSLVGVSGTSGSDGTFRLNLGCQTGLWSNTICLLVTQSGYQDACVPMGRGENLTGVIRQDVDLVPR